MMRDLVRDVAQHEAPRARHSDASYDEQVGTEALRLRDQYLRGRSRNGRDLRAIFATEVLEKRAGIPAGMQQDELGSQYVGQEECAVGCPLRGR
jgi:hypothetical protein